MFHVSICVPFTFKRLKLNMYRRYMSIKVNFVAFWWVTYYGLAPMFLNCKIPTPFHRHRHQGHGGTSHMPPLLWMSGHGAPWAEEQQMSNSKNISIHNGPKCYQSRFVVQTDIIWKSLISYIIFSVIEQLATVPKNKSMMLSGARQSSSHVVASLMSMRCETLFMTIGDDESRRDKNLMIPQPEVPQT